MLRLQSGAAVPGEYFTFQSMLIAWAAQEELQPPSCHDKMSREVL